MSFLVPKTLVKKIFSFKPISFTSTIFKETIKHIRKRSSTTFWELLGFIIVIITLLIIPFEISNYFALLFVAGLFYWSGLKSEFKIVKTAAYFEAIMFFILSMGCFFFYNLSWIPGKIILLIFLFILSTSVGLNYLLIVKCYRLKKSLDKTLTNRSKEVPEETVDSPKSSSPKGKSKTKSKGKERSKTSKRK